MFTKVSLGCWVDGANRGRYAGEEAQRLAASYGWKGEQLDANQEFYDDATDEATEYLNNLCEGKTMFVWVDGDLMHLEIEGD